MKTNILHGHMKAISSTKFNRTGDLLFSTARESEVMLWSSGFDGAECRRLGRFLGHEGTVDNCDVSFDSQLLVTAGTEGRVRLWNVETGDQVSVIHAVDDQPTHVASFSHGANTVLVVLKSAFGSLAKLCVHDVRMDGQAAPVSQFEWSAIISHAAWGPTSNDIYMSTDEGKSGALHIYDTRRKKQVKEVTTEHTGGIMDFAWLPDYAGLVTASGDRTGRLYESGTLECKKTYTSGEPLQAVAVHPFRPHVMLAGGTAAVNVTTTDAAGQRFLTRFYHMALQESIGLIGGHFSPVNTVNFHPRVRPEGLGFLTGGEDGFIRLYEFDDTYHRLDDGIDNLIPSK